jgi:endonuclease/exonuclease/phosphatase family metal-dependent hydrolase
LQVRTAHGLVLVATTHLLSPYLKAGQMNTERRIVQFKALLEKTTQAAGTDDMVLTGDFNWNEEYVAHKQHVSDTNILHRHGFTRACCYELL